MTFLNRAASCGAAAMAAALVAGPALAADADAANPSGDIVVTAQRRAERLQDVPLSITAVDAAGLKAAHVLDVTSIGAISPSITFRAQANGASSANVIIRGLGTTGTARAFEGAVGIFVDGVYRTRAAAVMSDFLDFDSLQVLRGPQGTLFGKNTSAGAVLLNSAKPRLTNSLDAEAEVGNYGTYRAKLAVGGGLSDTVAVRVAGLYATTDGYFTDPNTGAHLSNSRNGAAKAQILWQPRAGASLQLIADYSRNTGHCCFATQSFHPGSAQALINSLILARGLRLPSTAPGDFQQVLSAKAYQRRVDGGATLLGELALGHGTLKSVTALRKFAITQLDGDADFSGADILQLDEHFDSRFFSQELTYNGKLEALRADYVLGAYVSDEQLSLGRNLRWGAQAQTFWDAALGRAGAVNAAPGAWASEAMGGSNQSYAGFAHATFRLDDHWSLIAGLRYSIERKRGSFANPYFTTTPNTVFRVLGLMPAPAYNASTTANALSGTLGVQYRVNRDAQAYLTYNRGFKAGGIILDANGAGNLSNNPAINPNATALSPAYRPEKVDAVELGTKVTWGGGKVHTNLSVFYNHVADLQAAQFVGTQFTVLNAKSAQTYGAELENRVQLTDALAFSVDATWLPYAKYGVDPLLSSVLSGKDIRFVPRVAANAAFNLDTPVSEKVNVTGRVQMQHTSSEYLDNSTASSRGPLTLVNANLGLRAANKRWAIEAYVQNLTNQIYAETAFLAPLQGATENAYMAPPRSFGARLSLHY